MDIAPNSIGEYTKKRVSDTPIDKNSEAYNFYKKTIPKFIGEAIYIYSFKEEKMLYAHGWEELLGYKNEEITMLKIVSCTSPRHFNFSNELNDKALQFLKTKTTELEKYSFTLELEKIDKNGAIVPLFSRVGIFKSSEGKVEEIIGVSQIIKSLKHSNVMQYAAYGPDTSDFEEILNKELFKHFAISRKEKEALSMAAKGLAFKEIANELKVSQSAIEKRIIPLYKRFKVKSLPHLISFAHTNHIL
ncbi:MULTISPECIES: helix-turn-helix transcriptional regulator [Tenacibaculum]|uniref:helix-turn-helix transcriptional regulator n=1 Tax=Tenacibaculum TaxID=104267 RepID=UPI0021AE8E50|nr:MULTISPECIES: LuxR C-terminal-related transcriptional regulator [Tenacibaculum]MCT4699296.1 LuxR C-terminal-related transcriptional regulator [Tenacibaculum haliotis]WBX71587.1 LuxR C-terminal-related transcriptional regulator [Tenacibaculum retecalamus]